MPCRDEIGVIKIEGNFISRKWNSCIQPGCFLVKGRILGKEEAPVETGAGYQN